MRPKIQTTLALILGICVTACTQTPSGTNSGSTDLSVNEPDLAAETSDASVSDAALPAPDEGGQMMRPDGGMMRPDGGLMRPDGGLIRDDGGFMRDDGGRIPDDGGRIPDDGGLIRDDGGGVRRDGGLLRDDGGAIVGDGGPGQVPCAVDGDCVRACPRGALGCVCAANGQGSMVCSSTCNIDADCPVPRMGPLLTCTNGICRL